MNTDTPRTDAEYERIPKLHRNVRSEQMANCARALERELTQANQKIQELEKDRMRMDRLEKLATFAIWQGTFADNDYNISLGRAGAPIVTLSTMDADGSEVDEEIGRGDTLRAAIDSITKGKI